MRERKLSIQGLARSQNIKQTAGFGAESQSTIPGSCLTCCPRYKQKRVLLNYVFFYFL